MQWGEMRRRASQPQVPARPRHQQWTPLFMQTERRRTVTLVRKQLSAMRRASSGASGTASRSMICGGGRGATGAATLAAIGYDLSGLWCGLGKLRPPVAHIRVVDDAPPPSPLRSVLVFAWMGVDGWWRRRSWGADDEGFGPCCDPGTYDLR